MTKDFATKLIELRGEKNLTQQELGDAAGVSPSQISRYEAGIAMPRKTVMRKLANALGVSPEALQGEGNPDDVELMFDVNYRDFGKMRCSVHFTRAQHAKLTDMYQELDEKGRADLLGGFLKKATLESDIYVEPGQKLIPDNDEITSISARFVIPGVSTDEDG